MKLLISEELSSKTFRRDINALRAVAVMAVVLYHFSVPGFSGGFVGVDVFFVISGYLMTSIILKGISGNNFSILDFYFARIRRILPALILLCAFVLSIGWCLLTPDDYVVAARHAQDALLFTSNNTFRKEAGYFDVLSHDKWLLHTWSLSVEWQFYILLPLIISVIWLIFRNRLSILLSIILISIFSYISCVIKTDVDSAKAFYMLKYRAWEMTVGGIIVFIPSAAENYKKHLSILLLFGYSMIAVSIAFIDRESVWPGLIAALPVVGAAMVIYAARQDFILNRILPVNWIGTGSYSIYLWHWPVVVLLAYFQKSASGLWVIAGVFSSLALGWLSYSFIEEKTRYGFGLKNHLSAVVIVFSGAAVFSMAYLIVEKEGFISRVEPAVVEIAREKFNKESGAKKCIFGPDKELGPISCTYGGASIRTVVIGDSHAAALVSAVASAIKENDGGLYLWSRAACPFVRGAHTKIRNDCDSSVGWILEQVKTLDPSVPAILITRGSRYIFGDNEGVSGSEIQSPPVFFAERHSLPDAEFLGEYKKKAVETICELASGRKVYLVRPVPEMRVSVPAVMARYKMMGVERRVSVSFNEYYSRNKFVFELQEEAKNKCSGVEILDPLPYMCDKQACYADINGRPLYFDDDHLSEFGNKVLVPMFSQALNVQDGDLRNQYQDKMEK